MRQKMLLICSVCEDVSIDSRNWVSKECWAYDIIKGRYDKMDLSHTYCFDCKRDFLEYADRICPKPE